MKNWFNILFVFIYACGPSNITYALPYTFVSEGNISFTIFTQSTKAKKNHVIKIHTPEEFGAVGNGVNDDTQPLTKALNSAFNITFKKGKVYKTTNTIVIKSASKKVINLNSAIIKRDPSKIGLSFENCKEIVFKNGIIICSAAAKQGNGVGNCINYVQCKTITTSKLSIDGSDEMGIAHIACIGVTASYNTIKNCYRDGIHEIYCANVNVFGNNLSNIKDDALACHDYGTDAQKTFLISNGYKQASNIKIYNNFITNAYQGIASIACKNVEIKNNTVTATVGAAIAVFNTQAINIGGTARVDGASILNNKIINSCSNQKIMGVTYNNGGQNSTGRAAIFVGTLGTNGQIANSSRLSNVSVTGNNVTNCGVNGLWFTNTDKANFANNFFTDCCNETSNFSGTVCAIYNLTNASISNNRTIDKRAVKKHYFGFDLQNVTGNVIDLIDEGSKGGYHKVNAPDFKRSK